MVYLTFAYDFPLYNGSKKEEIGHCDGTLLTEKIILSAAHCCRPLLKPSIAIILYQLMSDKCELQKCLQGNPYSQECIEGLTECVGSELLKCGINMDANEECKELSYYLNMMTKLTYLKNATVEAGQLQQNNN